MKTFRFATAQDAQAILDIYRPYVEQTAITFECTLPTLEEFARRIEGIIEEYPYIVCEENGQIIGYAYAHRQMEREAYGWNAELSVYVNKNHLRCGIGKALYGCLLQILPLQGVTNVYGGVTLPNPNSEKLHESFGFQRLGVYHSTGYKCGEWHDVVWFEKQIGPYSSKPQAFCPIKRIDPLKMQEILRQAGSKTL